MWFWFLNFGVWTELTCTFTRDQCRPPLAMGRHGPWAALSGIFTSRCGHWRPVAGSALPSATGPVGPVLLAGGSIWICQFKENIREIRGWSMNKGEIWWQNFPCSHSCAGVGNWGGSLSDQRSGKECILQRVIGRTQLMHWLQWLIIPASVAWSRSVAWNRDWFTREVRGLGLFLRH